MSDSQVMAGPTVDGSNSPPSPPSLRRACDSCRSRKIRCDRNCPCSHCVQANIPCTKGVRRPREKRSRALVSTKYEEKINSIDHRLEGVTRLLQDLKTSMPSPDAQPAPSVSTAASRMDTTAHTPSSTPFGGLSQSTVNSPVVEGESSLAAHSAFANDFFRKAVCNNPVQASDRSLSEALDSLHCIVNALKHRTSKTEMSYPFAKPLRHPSPRDRELPPIEKAVALIHAAKNLDASAWICDLVPVEMFSDICLRVYFSENFSESDLIIANSGLLQLFLERSETTLEGKSENDSYTLMCRINLESALVDLPLHLPATADMITALLLGAMHAIEISKPSLAWTLSSKAWELCQTLGYHQLSPSKYNTISDEMRPKQLLFWILYFIDKNLSLRLGRASNIQNWDITTPMLPLHGTRSPLGATVAMWINTARCRGDVYQSLYSPEALSQPNHVRQSRAEALSSELHEIERKSREVNDHYLQEARQRFGNRIVEFMTLCDDVLRLSLLTLIYRASPPPEESSSAFIPPCIEAARATLQRHQDFLSVFKDVNSLYFSTYVHWALLLAPFTPFIVLFCHVIECQDETDLNRLQAFITSMESTPTLSEAAAKMHRLFQVLYQVALRYLENFSSDSNGGQPQSNATLNAYLTTLGLPILNQDIHHQGSSALSSNTSPGVNSQQAMEGALDTLRGLDGQEGIYPTVWMGNRNGLEEWFNGNHQMIDLLEEPSFNFPPQSQ